MSLAEVASVINGHIQKYIEPDIRDGVIHTYPLAEKLEKIEESNAQLLKTILRPYEDKSGGEVPVDHHKRVREFYDGLSAFANGLVTQDGRERLAALMKINDNIF